MLALPRGLWLRVLEFGGPALVVGFVIGLIAGGAIVYGLHKTNKPIIAALNGWVIGGGIELALATESGQTLRVLASSDQIDMLVDELEDVLNSPAEPGTGGPPEAA